MKQSLAIIRDWIEPRAPLRGPALNAPADEQGIRDTEKRLGIDFPQSIRELFLLANGQPARSVALEGSFTLMSLRQIEEAHLFLCGAFPDGVDVHDPDHESIDADPGVRAIWWSRGWIPVMVNGGGDYLCIDLAPADGGVIGQIITWYHDETFRERVATGMDALLAALADRLSSGRCRIEDGLIEQEE
jgi:cell wall assembly regulator SMI1